MAKLNVAPTKSSMLQLKRDLAFAREGYEMLEQKRQILLLELMGTVESATLVQKEVEEKTAAAYKALREALIRMGTQRVSADATAPRPEPTVEVESRSLMGIHVPHVSAQHPAPQPAASLLAGSQAMDDVVTAFRPALEAIDRLAEIENSVFRLSREVRKTQRRVNALEKIFLPAYQLTISYITSVLEERERDEFVIMRLVKERIEERRRAPSRAPQ